MAEQWSGFSYIVTNLARFIRPDEITFSGVNSTMPMLACLLAKRAYDWDYVYINVAGGVDPRPSHVPLSSSDPVLAEHTASIFANEDFYDLCTRGRMDLTFLGAAQIDGEGCANNSCIGDWHAPKVRLPGGGGGAVMLPTARRAAPGAPSTRRARWCPGWISSPHGRLSWRRHADRRVHQARRAAGPAVMASAGESRRGARAHRLRVRRQRRGTPPSRPRRPRRAPCASWTRGPIRTRCGGDVALSRDHPERWRAPRRDGPAKPDPCPDRLETLV